MAEQRPLGEVHPLGDGGSGDFARVLLRGQRYYGLHSHCAAFVGWEVLGMGFHGWLQKKVIYYYLTSGWCSVNDRRVSHGLTVIWDGQIFNEKEGVSNGNTRNG